MPEQETIQLDEVDSLRLENLSLKEHITALTKTLADAKLKEQKVAFNNYLIMKYKINSSTSRVEINQSDNTLTILSH